MAARRDRRARAERAAHPRGVDVLLRVAHPEPAAAPAITTTSPTAARGVRNVATGSSGGATSELDLVRGVLANRARNAPRPVLRVEVAVSLVGEQGEVGEAGRSRVRVEAESL